MKRNRGFIPILIIAIIAALAIGGGVYYSYHVKNNINITNTYVTPVPYTTPVTTPYMSPAPDATGQHCGGFMINPSMCPTGYTCKLNIIPDTGGKCVKDTSTDSTSSKIILKVYAHGGLCVDGQECASTTTIDSNGVVNFDGSNKRTLSKAEMASLTAAISGANFKAIESTKFIGTCPADYDGQEVVYTFYTSSGTHELDSCKVVWDKTSKLFQTVGASISFNEDFTLIKDPKTVCAQVITHAKNPSTGEEKDFPTPCNVPKGWIVMQTSL